MPGFGTVGPYIDFVAFGEMIEPFAGLSELTGYPGPSTRLTGTPAQYHRPAPNLGEHNRQILEGLLGLSPAEIEDLEVQGVIGTVVP